VAGGAGSGSGWEGRVSSRKRLKEGERVQTGRKKIDEKLPYL